MHTASDYIETGRESVGADIVAEDEADRWLTFSTSKETRDWLGLLIQNAGIDVDVKTSHRVWIEEKRS